MRPAGSVGHARRQRRSSDNIRPIDAQIADKLRAVITSGQFDKRIDRAPEREAMAAFYAARNYAPLWIADGKLDARAKAVIAQLRNAAADGLDPADYQVPAFGAASGPEALADADITLTYSVLTYARHLRPAASRRPGCWRKSTTAITRRRRPISCASSPMPPMPAPRSKASIRRTADFWR